MERREEEIENLQGTVPL